MDWMNTPVVALSISTLFSLVETLVEGEVMSYAIPPAWISNLEVRILLFQGVVNVLQPQLLSGRLHDGLGYQLNVGSIWLPVLLHFIF